jgi:hypothetical protein
VTGGGLNKKIEAIREMIDHRLKSLSEAATVDLPSASHLDEDTISAFVEGHLSPGESKPVVAHLTVCHSCRHASAQLVRLENQIDADSTPESLEEEPGRLQAFISNLSSLVPSAGEEVVFAYQNPQVEEDSEKANVSDESGDDEKPAEAGEL